MSAAPVALGTAVARRYALICAVEGWSGSDATVYGRSHALALAFLRDVDSAAAAALHDSGARKPWALGPLRFAVRPNRHALLELEL